MFWKFINIVTNKVTIYIYQWYFTRLTSSLRFSFWRTFAWKHIESLKCKEFIMSKFLCYVYFLVLPNCANHFCWNLFQHCLLKVLSVSLITTLPSTNSFKGFTTNNPRLLLTFLNHFFMDNAHDWKTFVSELSLNSCA